MQMCDSKSAAGAQYILADAAHYQAEPNAKAVRGETAEIHAGDQDGSCLFWGCCQAKGSVFSHVRGAYARLPVGKCHDPALSGHEH